jgi:2-hydroxychromene-2-carboxylate isomerase
MAAAEFWYEFASTYSYPAAMRAAALAQTRGVTLIWRPFLLGPIFAAQGWRDSPFNIYPAKGRYMWRDLERICTAQGLPLRRPNPFPQNSLLAARVALALDGETRVEGRSRSGRSLGASRRRGQQSLAEGRDRESRQNGNHWRAEPRD